VNFAFQAFLKVGRSIKWINTFCRKNSVKFVCMRRLKDLDMSLRRSIIAQVYGLATCEANECKFNSCIMTKSWFVEGQLIQKIWILQYVGTSSWTSLIYMDIDISPLYVNMTTDIRTLPILPVSKIHAISWTPDFYKILQIFQIFRKYSKKNHKHTVFSNIIVCLDLFMKFLNGNL
jgi:hypothetical protein